MDLKGIPFGAQYYRAPTPEEADFERDLERFSAQGFNTIKIWAQWRWNNPSDGVYDFRDLKQLLEIAGRRSLGVVVNIICDVAPAWLFMKHPDALMELADGRRLYPQTTAWRQVGGAPGPLPSPPRGRGSAARVCRGRSQGTVGL